MDSEVVNKIWERLAGADFESAFAWALSEVKARPGRHGLQVLVMLALLREVRALRVDLERHGVAAGLLPRGV